MHNGHALGDLQNVMDEVLGRDISINWVRRHAALIALIANERVYARGLASFEVPLTSIGRSTRDAAFPAILADVQGSGQTVG